MNSKEFKKALDNIVKEKDIDPEVVYDAMELALTSAYKKNFNSKTNVKVLFDRATGEIKVYSFLTVVEDDKMTKEELKRKQYDTWNKYYQKHKSEINARRKKVREGYKNKLSVAEKRIEEREKENAELKKLKRECETSLCRAEYQYNYEQLTKAKELLKQWLQTSKASGCDNINIITDTEQFLSEVKK